MQIIVVFSTKGTVTRTDATVSSTVSRRRRGTTVITVSHHPLRHARSYRARDRGKVGEGGRTQRQAADAAAASFQSDLLIRVTNRHKHADTAGLELKHTDGTLLAYCHVQSSNSVY